MNHLSSLRSKIFTCEVLLFVIFAITGFVVFAHHGDSKKQGTDSVKTKDSVKSDFVPVVKLTSEDGKEQKFISVSDFLRLVKNADDVKSISEADTDDLIDLKKLELQTKKGEAKIKMLGDIAKKIDDIGKPKPKDSWIKEGLKGAIETPKTMLRSTGVFLVKLLATIGLVGVIVVGGGLVYYEYVWKPLYCKGPFPGLMYVASYAPGGSLIPERWYSEDGMCAGYFDKKAGSSFTPPASMLSDSGATASASASGNPIPSDCNWKIYAQTGIVPARCRVE